MSSSPSPTSPAIPPSSSSADSPPPPSSLSPPPISNSPPPFSSPPVPSAPSPTPPSPSSPPPAFSPPSSPTSPPVTPPPPDLSSPPVTPPPPDLSSPPVTPPPPDLTSPPVTPPPPDLTSPLPSSPPAASPPPPPTPAVSPPPITPPPPPIEAKPMPTLTPPPPPSPNASAPPPPDRTSSPRPNADSPPPPSVPSSPQIPIASPPPPHLPGKPTGTSPPPPAADSPKSSPSPPPQEMSRSPPSVPSAPPPKSTLPPPRTTPPPPANSSGGATTPSPVQASSPVPSTNLPDNSTNPIPENTNSSNSFAPASGVPGNSTSGGGTTNTAAAVSIGLAAVFVLLCSLGLAVWFVRRRRKSVAGYAAGFVMPSPLTSSIMSESPHPRSPTAPLIYHHHHHHKSGSVGSEAGIVSAQSPFSYDELFAITNGFSPQNILGEGGFGCVYKGCLPDGREVAVKQLKVGSGQGEREFKAEVEIISRVHHRHLVSLVGYCISENQRLLVYDFVPNGTLDSHIHGKGKAVLDWPTRVKVAAGAARGIAYLHEDCHPRIIHRDIKSSNILLDNNFETQVSDFGLARLAMDCKTHVTTRVIGTFGYLAPEYASSGKLTDRSDVYSFGVVLLELITGRKPVDDSQPMGDESLVEWARPRLTHALETRDFGELPDSRLEKNYNEMEMLRMVEAAAACIRQSAAVRPQMGKVVRILDALADADLTNGVKPRQSEVSDGRELSELRLLQRLAFGSQVFASEHSHSSWSGQSDI